MNRYEGIERSEKARHGGKPTWDIFHVWPDQTVRDGVRYTSTVHVYPAEPPKSGSAKVRLWIPGGRAPGQQGEVEHEIGWGTEIWAAVADWGMASVVSTSGDPLHFYWELSAGKGEGASRGVETGVQIRTPTTPPPGV